MTETIRWFPVRMDEGSRRPHGVRFRIPWSIAEKAYKIYETQGGLGQSLERIAGRGGFGLLELIWLLAGAPDEWPEQTDFHNRFREEKEG